MGEQYVAKVELLKHVGYNDILNIRIRLDCNITYRKERATLLCYKVLGLYVPQCADSPWITLLKTYVILFFVSIGGLK